MLTINAATLADAIAIGAQKAQDASTGLSAGLISTLNEYPLAVRTAVLALAASIQAGVHST
jgi:hypothetical protein